MLGADRAALAGGTPPEQLATLGEELLDVIFRFPDHVWVFLHDLPALTGKNAETFSAPSTPGWRSTGGWACTTTRTCGCELGDISR